MRKILTRVEEQQVIKRYKSGATLKQIAATYGIHYSTIGRIIIRYKIERPERIGAHSYRLAEHQKKKIIVDFQAGIPLPELAEKYDLAISSIHTMLKRRAIVRPERSRGTWKFSEEQKRNIEEEYKTGVSSYILAKKYKTTDSAILQMLGRRGTKKRTIKETRRRFPVNHNAFSSIDENTAYWVGFLMADGSMRKDRLALEIAGKDKCHLIKFANYVGFRGPIRTRIVRNRPYITVGFTSPEIAARLKVFGIIENKSKVAELKILDSNRHTWRGIIDGDGWLGKKKPSIGLCGSVNIVRQFMNFLNVSGILVNNKIRMHGAVRVVAIGGRNAIKIMHLLYDNCHIALMRKHSIATKQIKKLDHKMANCLNENGIEGKSRRLYVLRGPSAS